MVKLSTLRIRERRWNQQCFVIFRHWKRPTWKYSSKHGKLKVTHSLWPARVDQRTTLESVLQDVQEKTVYWVLKTTPPEITFSTSGNFMVTHRFWSAHNDCFVSHVPYVRFPLFVLCFFAEGEKLAQLVLQSPRQNPLLRCSDGAPLYVKKFIQTQIYAGTIFCELAFVRENHKNLCLAKISRYTVKPWTLNPLH